MNKFKVGDNVTLSPNCKEHLARRIRNKHGEGPYTVTSYDLHGLFARINGEASGWDEVAFVNAKLQYFDEELFQI